MDLISIAQHFSLLDMIAVTTLIGAWIVMSYVIENPPKARPSTAVLMSRYRRDWMVQHVTRTPRIYDATILTTLRDGTTFLASACLIAIGGGLAALANVDRVSQVAEDIMLEAPVVVWDTKILLVLVLVTSAFLKFVWANRLFGYCGVLMASVPNDPNAPDIPGRVNKATSLNMSAARAFNRGLRSVYFALGALGWLLGPIPLIVTTAITVTTLTRREFMSTSRSVLLTPNEISSSDAS